jgi:hypothetical protein
MNIVRGPGHLSQIDVANRVVPGETQERKKGGETQTKKKGF